MRSGSLMRKHSMASLTPGLLVIGLAMGSGVAAAATSACQLVRIAEWTVRVERNELFVDGGINAQKVTVKLDTGSMRTLLFRSAATRLGLTLRRTRGRIFGVGGEADLEVAFLDQFTIGQTTRPGFRVLVADDHERGHNVDVLLGEDFFHKLDVEFDLAHNAVRLYEPKDCGKVSLAYWAPTEASEAEIEPIDDARPRIILKVQINGKSVPALLDSGATISLLNKSDAAAAGVTPETPGVALFGTSTGLGRKSLITWMGPFQSVLIGDELIKDTVLPFADLYRDASYTPIGSLLPRSVDQVQPMLLGVDFLRAHRVLVAHSQRKIYFTYAGGPVFQMAGARPPVSDRPPPDFKP